MSEPTFIDSSIANDGFWPDVPVRRFIEGWRVPNDTRDEMIRSVLMQAMFQVNEAVSDAKAQAKEAGFGTLAAYIASLPPDELNDEPILQMLYLFAVYHLAKAATIKLLQSVNRKPADVKQTDAFDDLEINFQDAYQQAVTRLLNRMGVKDTHTGTNFGAYVGLIGADRSGLPRQCDPSLRIPTP